MKSKALVMGAVLFLGVSTSNVFADTPSLQDMRFNVNGGWTQGTGPGVNLGAFDTTTGLGAITYTTHSTGAGFFDVFVDEGVSTPFFNEFGSTSGSPVAGQSWEIGDSSASASSPTP